MEMQISRKYQRLDCFWYGWHIEAQISKDNQKWVEIEVPSISAGGLMFKVPDNLYAEGDTVWLNVYVNPKMLYFPGMSFQTKAVVKGTRELPGGEAVGVDFETIQILLDDIINSIAVKYGELVE